MCTTCLRQVSLLDQVRSGVAPHFRSEFLLNSVSLVLFGLLAADVKNKKATTHIHRTDLICRQAESGQSYEDVKVHQGFEHTTATDVYMRGSFIIKAMLPAVGWTDKDSYFCWWESSGESIPKELMSCVMPGLDEVAELAALVHEQTGGDASAVAVCDVLKRCRKIFIEDAVYRQGKYPLFPAYQHTIFVHPMLYGIFQQYSIAEKQRMSSRRSEYLKRDADVLYKLNNQAELIESLVIKFDKFQQEGFKGGSSSGDAGGIGGSSSGDAGGIGGSGSSKPKVFKPLPTMPKQIEPLSLSAFYGTWDSSWRGMMGEHFVEHKEYAWADVFGKQPGATIGKRWHMYKDFLLYIDGFAVPLRKQVLEAFEQFAFSNGISFTKVVKKVFYHIARPHTQPDADVAGLVPALKQRLDAFVNQS